MARAVVARRDRAVPGIATAIVRSLVAAARNPVLLWELRARMRGRRSQSLLIGYALVLCAICLLVWTLTSLRGELPVDSAAVGRWTVATVLGIQSVLVFLLPTALAAGSIATERDRRTLELLVATQLTAEQIVAGKWLAAWAYSTLLLLLTVPLAALSFLTGGVSVAALVAAYAVMVAGALCHAALGVLCSAMVRQTIGAMGVALAIAVGGLIVLYGYGLAMDLATQVGGFPSSFRALLPVGPTAMVVRQEAIVDNWFGWRLPAWTLALGAYLVVANALYCAAVAHLEYFPERRPHRPLVAATVAWIVLVTLWVGGGVDVRRTVSGVAPMEVEGLETTLLAATHLVLPALATLSWPRRRWGGVALLWGGYLAALVAIGIVIAGGSAARAALILSLATARGLATVGVARLAWCTSRSPWSARLVGVVAPLFLAFLAEVVYDLQEPASWLEWGSLAYAYQAFDEHDPRILVDPAPVLVSSLVWAAWGILFLLLAAWAGSRRTHRFAKASVATALVASAGSPPYNAIEGAPGGSTDDP